MKKIWPTGIILVIWLLFSFPYWGKGFVPFPSRYLVTFFAPWSSLYGMPVKNNAMPDVITQIYPWKRVTIDAWKHGELPLWNPYSFSGTSHVGNYQSAIFSPVNSIFLFLPEIHAWSVMILLQPLLAGVFMFLFLRSLTISRLGSVMGSLSFMFCGFIVVWMAYGTLGYAVLFLPLVLYSINTFIANRSTWAAALASVALALSFLSGHFQMSLYVLIYTICYMYYKRARWPILLFVGIGICLAAPQILPAFESYTQSLRSSIFTKGEIIPWQYLITLFSPDFFGNPVTRNDWFGHYAEWASYIGVAPLLLAFLALWNKSKPRLASFFIFMTVISMLFAFQTPLVDFLYMAKIPVLSTSSASRIIVLASFSLAVLSGFGFDVLIYLWNKRNWKKIIYWCLGVITIIISVWVTLIFFRPLPPDKLIVAIRNTYLPTLMAGATLGIVVLGFLVPKRMATVLSCIVILITAADVYRFAAKWMPFDPPQYVYPELAVITKIKSLTRLENSRVFGNIGNEVGSAYKIPLIEGYDAVYQERYGRFISAVTSGQLLPPERSVVTVNKHGRFAEDVLQLLGIRYYMHKKSDGRFPWAYPYWELSNYRRVWEDDHFEILENTASLPRVFLASSYVVSNSEQEILDYLFSQKTNNRETLVLEKKPLFEPEPGEGVATILSYRLTEVVIETVSKVPKLLFMSDVFDKGWRSYIDDKPVELYRADYDFRAIAVPAGTHKIRMRYRPVSVVLGMIISGTATLIMTGFLVWKRQI